MSGVAAFADVTGGLPAQAWESLARNRLYSTRDWLRFCSTDVGGQTVTGAVHVDGGRAAVPVTAVEEESNGFYRWHEQLTDRGLPAPDPVGILVGSRRGYQTQLLAADGVAPADAVDGLLDRVRELRWKAAGTEVLPSVASGPVSCVAMFLDTGDVLTLRAAGVATLPVLLTTDAWMAVPEGGWPEWLRALPSKGRRDSIKQEVKAFHAAGYELRRAPLAESYREAAELLAGTQRRHHQPYDIDMLAESLRRQAVAMGPVAQVVFCARPGEPAVGFCLYYVHGDTLFVRAVGLDYERLHGGAEYFNLVYYESVRTAGERGLRWVHPGIESPDAKALRGARLRPRWLLDLAEDSVLSGHDDAIRAYNKAEVSRLTALSPAVAKALELDQCAPFC
jgi:uncharacterized protein